MTAVMIDQAARMRQILAEMSVIAEASGARLGDVIHGGEPDRSPHGPRTSLAEYHARQWRRARTHEARCEAVKGAEDALSNARYAPRRLLLKGTLEWRLAIARDPHKAEDVARIYETTVNHVYFCRRAVRANGGSVGTGS